MEDHDLAGTRVPAALSATRTAARIPQGALLRAVEPGQPRNAEAVAVDAGTKTPPGARGKRTGKRTGFSGMSLLRRGDGRYRLDLQIKEPTARRVTVTGKEDRDRRVEVPGASLSVCPGG